MELPAAAAQLLRLPELPVADALVGSSLTAAAACRGQSDVSLQ